MSKGSLSFLRSWASFSGSAPFEQETMNQAERAFCSSDSLRLVVQFSASPRFIELWN
jgi:hypothetical protein